MPQAVQSGKNRSPAAARPTNVRLIVVIIAAATSVLLYLDRFCVSFAADYIKEDLHLTQEQVGYFLSAFFFSYALAQVPAGWLSDRYGARIMLAIYILVWSVFTAMIGAVHSFALLLLTRLACGLGQAGAYPTCASVLSKWVPFRKRGAASAWISLGGRLGGAIAPLLTAFLIVQFVPSDTPVEFRTEDIKNGPRLCAKIFPGEVTVEVSLSGAHADMVGRHVWSLLSDVSQQVVRRGAGHFEKPNDNKATPPQLAPQDTVILVAAMNELLASPQLYNEEAFKSANLARETLSTLSRGDDQRPLTGAKLRRFNRLLLEAGFANEVSKLYVRGWRPVMYVYGFAGIIVAAAVWIVYRNRPEVHPWCNAAECQLIAAERPVNAPSPHGKAGMIPIGRLLKSRSMWLSCLAQLGTNIGWVFLVTWFPRYLISQHNVPILQRGLMAMTPLMVGIAGMYCGGWLTDNLTRHLGVRWGRRLPLSVTRFAAAGGYGLCLWFSTFGAESAMNSPWMYVAAFSLVAFSTDMGVPASWAFNQDVGGRYVGSILGWGNMWGNLGASFSPPIYNYFLGETPGPSQWNAMFVCCLAAFVFSGICGLGIDAATPIAPPDEASVEEG